MRRLGGFAIALATVAMLTVLAIYLVVLVALIATSVLIAWKAAPIAVAATLLVVIAVAFVVTLVLAIRAWMSAHAKRRRERHRRLVTLIQRMVKEDGTICIDDIERELDR